MEPGKKRAKSSPKLTLQRYLFPITIISSTLISGSVGYIASQIAINNSSSDSAEINAFKKRITENRNNSIVVIETEIPIIINDLEKYNQDINLLVKNVDWLKENLDSIRDATGTINTTITVINGINNFANIPFIDKYSNDLAFAQSTFVEVDSILGRLENLTVIQKEISDSHRKLNLLHKEYQKEKSIEQLLLIEQELNSSLIYQIEDLRNITTEAQEVFELSSGILTTVNQAKSLYNSIRDTGENTLEAIQFWKDIEEDSEIGTNIKENLEKALEASKEEIQDLPKELDQQSKDSITSINNVKKELQTIKLAQMVMGE